MFFANNAAAALVKVRLELQGRIVAARVPRVNSDRTVSTTVIVTTVIFTIDHLKKNKKNNRTPAFTFTAGALCNPVDGKCKCKPGCHHHHQFHIRYHHDHGDNHEEKPGYAGARCEDLCPEGYFGQDCYQVVIRSFWSFGHLHNGHTDNHTLENCCAN